MTCVEAINMVIFRANCLTAMAFKVLEWQFFGKTQKKCRGNDSGSLGMVLAMWCL